jgi:alpha-tubulin suppressor-like RCC1 family protein/uncharacterized protein YjdB
MAGLVLSACGETTEPIRVAAVVVTPGNATLGSLGETVQLSASARDANGNPMAGPTFTWTSSDNGVATVSTSTGVVTAVGNGSATIGAMTAGISGTATVLVDQVVVALQVTPATDTLTALAATVQLTPEATDARGNPVTDVTLNWETSDADVATVDPSTGLVTAVDNGDAVITATTDGISDSAAITVADPAGVGPKGNTISAVDGAVTLVFPAGAVDEAITVTVDAAVSPPNPAMRLLPGATFDFGPEGTQFNAPVALTITYDPAEMPAGTQQSSLRLFHLVDSEWVQVSGSTVDAESQTVTGEITSFSVYGVLLVPVAEVTITPESAEILQGATVQLEATLQDLDGSVLTGREVTWASLDEAVAKVDATGLVTGVAAGMATIAATSEGESGSATITVVVPTGDLEVLASTSGEDLDPDGYIVTVDDTHIQPIAVTGTVTFVDLASGEHAVELTNVAANCAVTGDNPRTVNVPFAGTAQTTFDVSCQPLPEIDLSPPAASLVATEGGADPAAETVNVTNSGGGVLSGLALGTITYGTGEPAGWLAASLSGPTAPATITLQATTGSLSAGTYTAMVPVTSGVARNSPQVIDVTFTVQARPTTVTDLTVVGRTSVTLTVRFTEVDNGIGGPADYDIRHAVSPIHWGQADGSAIVVPGTQIGLQRQVTIIGLSPATQYDVRLVAFRGTLNVDAVFSDLSNIVTGTTLASGATWASVTAGDDHTCGITTGRVAYCWGDAGDGALGNGSLIIEKTATPVPIVGGHTFAMLSAAYDHTCGVTTSGDAYCWGLDINGVGLLGLGYAESYTNIPAKVAGGLTFQSVSAGGRHTCGVTTAGDAYCWGSNEFGELGTNTESCFQVDACSLSPVKVQGGLRFRSVSTGSVRTCGVTTDGAAYCWGSNIQVQLGNETAPGGSTTPVLVPGGFSFRMVTAHKNHTCGVTATGAAYCWGRNDSGQLGNNSTTSSAEPVAVIGGYMPSVLGGHVCGVTTTCDAYCWGANHAGQLGAFVGESSTTPTPVVGGFKFVLVSAGGVHTCGVTTAGKAYCWGEGREGQLGQGTFSSVLTPVRVRDP